MKIEKLENSHRFYQQGLITRDEIEKAMKQALELVDHNMIKFGERFPWPATKQGEYVLMDNTEWTNGFWTGMVWLAYDVTRDEKYRILGEKHVDSFLHRIENKIEVDHHDLGFLYIPSCVSAYKLTGNQNARKAALLAADQLASRYQEKGGFIQAWGELGAEDNYRLIVDCLLNIPLLYWAAEETGDSSYVDMANTHYKSTVETAFREDASTFHTYYFDPKTGEPVKGMTRQGYADDSSWARGQAWAIYGTALQYYANKDESIFPDFKAVTNYFLNRLPEDNVPFWDLIFTDGDLQSRDSSSSAIAVCGMHEMLKYLPETDPERQVYQQSMHTMMRAMMTNYTYKDLNTENALLRHGVYSWHSGKGVDEGNIWGDYFYLEALVRFYKDWELYW
ncbi:glycoside hydrolase family 88 protein [Vagococcus sp. PNs007]|uniref:Glucuronyl hydrolase n=2 Tax=Vagococcus TaxID=2737 RepID=A0A430A640_9ENTE|nr:MULTISPECIES: glycoside hydrolase family 88 protein [Vagococcus]MDF0480081.1 glycoside hydrolase family 88 protein [Vagococcus proximus]RSU02362.1 glucuronyl hydrolase [Vagococcus fessus]